MITDPGQWDNDRWPNFRPSEFICRGSGDLYVDESFLDALQALRRRHGGPLRITSGYRSPAYNARISSTGTTGPHTTGRACDIRIERYQARGLLPLIEDHFTGLGINQKGSGRFIHLDMVPGPLRLWTY